MRALFALAVVLIVFATSLPAQAHKPSDSYLTLTLSDAGASGRWDIALRDLDHVIGLDLDQDGALTWGEVRANHQAIAAYALSRLSLETGSQVCRLAAGEQLIETHSDGAYAVLLFEAACPSELQDLAVSYNLLFDVDPLHRGLLKLDDGTQTTSVVLSPERPVHHWQSGRSTLLASFTTYLRDGIWHIWIGFDHILFLITLLLPAVLRREAGRWYAAPNIREAMVPVLKVVTAFTVAHSLTLSAAALGVVELPSRLVESAIAVSIIVAALNNVWPLVTARLWVLAFGFGLIHGFGFASVLADLGLPKTGLAVALLGFNLGVEIGQLAIVAALLPIIYALKAWPQYRRIAMPLGSLAMAALAGVWLLERSFDIQIGPI
jgi:hypothetical protein